MVTIETLERLADKYGLPLEDVLFIALNFSGVNFSCDFNRMRMGFRLDESDEFAYAGNRGVLDYYFALAVNKSSDFAVDGDKLLLSGKRVGAVINPSEDFCDSHYPRRGGTVLNLNPNQRTSCRGCKFCYTGYQIPRDRKRIACADDLKAFLDGWLRENSLVDLSGLIQVAVVTGCYEAEEDLKNFILVLRKVLNYYRFGGEIFYLGSQITDERSLKDLQEINPFGYCVSLECFERRQGLLRDVKNKLELKRAFELMALAEQLGFRVNFSYVLGLENLAVVARHLADTLRVINSFPIFNIIQIHKYHSREILAVQAQDLEYFLKARDNIEKVFINTVLRPRVWENYRSPWYLKFADEELIGVRTP